MILARVIALAIGYLIGNFQTGYLYGKSKGVDIRKCGSGNSGTTNTLRTLGKKAGIITFLGDSIKAVVAVWVIYMIFRNSYPADIKLIELYAGFGTVLGHNFPFYMNFKGGKGVACTAGVITAVYPVGMPVCFFLFTIPAVITRYVSLSSLIMVTGFFVEMVFLNHNGYLAVTHTLEFDILAACFTVMCFWRHRENIKRLVNGTERKLGEKAQIRK